MLVSVWQATSHHAEAVLLSINELAGGAAQ